MSLNNPKGHNTNTGEIPNTDLDSVIGSVKSALPQRVVEEVEDTSRALTIVSPNEVTITHRKFDIDELLENGKIISIERYRRVDQLHQLGYSRSHIREFKNAWRNKIQGSSDINVIGEDFIEVSFDAHSRNWLKRIRHKVAGVDGYRKWQFKLEVEF